MVYLFQWSHSTIVQNYHITRITNEYFLMPCIVKNIICKNYRFVRWWRPNVISEPLFSVVRPSLVHIFCRGRTVKRPSMTLYKGYSVLIQIIIDFSMKVIAIDK